MGAGLRSRIDLPGLGSPRHIEGAGVRVWNPTLHPACISGKDEGGDQNAKLNTGEQELLTSKEIVDKNMNMTKQELLTLKGIDNKDFLNCKGYL